MTGYTKLFASILTSTVWQEDAATRLLWITMLALADRDGVVEASIPGLASLARVSLDEAESAIQKFQSPDKYSRTPDHDGRRIEPIQGGWLILNHAKYRHRMSPEDIRERDRLRKAAYRERKRSDRPTPSGTNWDNSEKSEKSDIAHPEAEPEAKGKRRKKNTPPAASAAVVALCNRLRVTGRRNTDAIQHVTRLECERSGQSEEQVTARLFEAWEAHQLYSDNGFRYSAPVAFFQSGTWPNAINARGPVHRRTAANDAAAEAAIREVHRKLDVAQQLEAGRGNVR